MSAGRDLKILIKTIADMTGLSRLGRGVTEHSRSVRALGGIYRAAARAGAAGFRLVGSAIGAVNAGLRRLRNYSMIASAALTAIAVKGTKEWMDKEDAVHNLAGAIETLGFDVDALLPKFNALADEMQDATRMSDDQTRALIEVLLNLGIMPDKIDEAVRGSIGLAKVMRTDAATAARYFAVSLEGDYTMLRRYIPALRSATSESEQAAIVQRVMAAGFNQATAAAGNAAGRFQQLRNRIGDLWARLGQSVAEALNLTDAFHRAERAVKALIESAVWDRITDGLRNAFDTVVVNVRTIRELIAEVRNMDVADRIEAVKSVAINVVTAAFQTFLALLQGSSSVFLGIGKMIGSALATEILKLPIPGFKMARRELTRGARPGEGPEGESRDERKERMAEFWSDWDRAMAGDANAFSRIMSDRTTKAMQDGLDHAVAAVPETISRVQTIWGQAADKSGETIREKTGFDYGARVEQHREARVEERRDIEVREAMARMDRMQARLDAEEAARRKRAAEPFRRELGARQAGLDELQSEHASRMAAPVGAGMRGGLERRRLEMAIARETERVREMESAVREVETHAPSMDRVIQYLEKVSENERRIIDKLNLLESKQSRLPI